MKTPVYIFEAIVQLPYRIGAVRRFNCVRNTSGLEDNLEKIYLVQAIYLV